MLRRSQSRQSFRYGDLRVGISVCGWSRYVISISADARKVLCRVRLGMRITLDKLELMEISPESHCDRWEKFKYPGAWFASDSGRSRRSVWLSQRQSSANIALCMPLSTINGREVWVIAKEAGDEISPDGGLGTWLDRWHGHNTVYPRSFRSNRYFSRSMLRRFEHVLRLPWSRFAKQVLTSGVAQEGEGAGWIPPDNSAIWQSAVDCGGSLQFGSAGCRDSRGLDGKKYKR